MRMDSKSIGTPVAQLAFLALFPGFFFYQSAIGTGAASAILGGYFSPVALFFLPFLGFFYLHEAAKGNRFLTRTDLAFWGFLAFFTLAVGFNYAAGAPSDVAKHHAVAIMQLTSVFIVFRLADFHSKAMQWMCIACVAGMTAIIFIMSVDGFFYLKIQGDPDSADAVATYQGFARSYLATLLVVLPFSSGMWLRLLVYAIAVPALFLNGARSELIAFLLLMAIVEIFRTRHKMLLFGLLFLVAAGALTYADEIIDMLPVNRSVQLLDIDSASSWEARNFLLAQALATIASHPVLGDYGSYFYLFGSSGSYAHNILSAWVDLGFAGFLWLFCMSVLPLHALAADLIAGREQPDSREFMLTFSLMLTTLIMLFAAKSFTYMMIGAALGLYARHQRVSAHAKSRSSQGRSSDLRPFPQRHAHLRQAVP
jgi:hypothetical protein